MSRFFGPWIPVVQIGVAAADSKFRDLLSVISAHLREPSLLTTVALKNGTPTPPAASPSRNGHPGPQNASVDSAIVDCAIVDNDAVKILAAGSIPAVVLFDGSQIIVGIVIDAGISPEASTKTQVVGRYEVATPSLLDLTDLAEWAVRVGLPAEILWPRLVAPHEEFRELLKKFAKRYALKEAEEVALEARALALGRWLKNPPAYSPTRGAFRPFLNYISINYVREVVKPKPGRDKEHPMPPVDSQGPSTSPDSGLSRADIYRKVFEELSHTGLAVLLLLEQGYEQKEIAEILGLSETQVCRIVGKMRKLLEDSQSSS
jgi:DNA-binding NarL/FixJ family response regulator